MGERRDRRHHRHAGADDQFVPTPTSAPAACALDGNGTGAVTVDEILAAVNAALNGCS